MADAPQPSGTCCVYERIDNRWVDLSRGRATVSVVVRSHFPYLVVRSPAPRDEVIFDVAFEGELDLKLFTTSMVTFRADVPEAGAPRRTIGLLMDRELAQAIAKAYQPHRKASGGEPLVKRAR